MFGAQGLAHRDASQGTAITALRRKLELQRRDRRGSKKRQPRFTCTPKSVKPEPKGVHLPFAAQGGGRDCMRKRRSGHVHARAQAQIQTQARPPARTTRTPIDLSNKSDEVVVISRAEAKRS